MNVVVLSGTIAKGGAHISYTKNGKPQTTFELIVPNDESPGYYTKEAILVVGMHAEATCEQLEPGDEVELSGKLQRGQVVCFRVHIKQSALAGVAQDERMDTDPSPGMSDDVPNAPGGAEERPLPKKRARYPRRLQQPWEGHEANHH
jgi:hypothetical protein